MRCFIAIKSDDESSTSLAKYQDEFFATFRQPDYKERKKVDGTSIQIAKTPFRRAKKNQLHLTLLFLGNNVEINSINIIKRKLQKIASKTPAFEMECIGFGTFPKPTNAKVLFAGLKSKNVEWLVGKIRDQLAPLGFSDNKKFNPHITIARNRDGGNASSFVKKYANEVWSKKNWKVNSICLFESVQHLDGYEHEIIAEYSLDQSYD